MSVRCLMLVKLQQPQNVAKKRFRVLSKTKITDLSSSSKVSSCHVIVPWPGWAAAPRAAQLQSVPELSVAWTTLNTFLFTILSLVPASRATPATAVISPLRSP